MLYNRYNKGRIAVNFRVMSQYIMKMTFSQLAALGLFSVSAAAGATAYAQGADLSLLDSLDRGLWQLRAVGGGNSAAVDKLCVGDPARFTQIQHGDTPCTRYVIRSTPNSVTVSYTCRGYGQGLTTIRKESGGLIQIQSQGIRNNSPFSFSVEARRTGAC